MQSIIDKLQTPQSFSQSIQELVIALQRTGDPGKLTSIRHDLDQLSAVDVNAGKKNTQNNLKAMRHFKFQQRPLKIGRRWKLA